MGEVINLEDYLNKNQEKSQNHKSSLKDKNTAQDIENKVLSYKKNCQSKARSEKYIFTPDKEKREQIEIHASKNFFQNIIDVIKKYISFNFKKNSSYPFIDDDYLIKSKIDGSQLVRADKIEDIIGFISKGGSGKVEYLGYYDTGYTIGDFIRASNGETIKDQSETTYLNLSEDKSKAMAGMLDLYFGDRLCPEYFVDPYIWEFLYEALGSIIYDYCKYFHSPSDKKDVKISKKIGSPTSYDKSEIEGIVIPKFESERHTTNGDIYVRLSNCISLLAFLDGTELEHFETEDNMKETLFQTAKQGYVSKSMVNFLIHEVGTYFHMKRLGESLDKAVGSLDFSKQEEIPKQTDKPYLRVL